MAFIAAPLLPTAPTEPHKGAAVLAYFIAPGGVIVMSRDPLPAPNIFQLINAVNAYPV